MNYIAQHWRDLVTSSAVVLGGLGAGLIAAFIIQTVFRLIDKKSEGVFFDSLRKHERGPVWLLLPLMGCQHSTTEITHQNHELETGVVTIGDQSWNVEIAQTTEQRQQGLMRRESLAENAGMFFVFEEEDFYAFWMKNTLIPLDIIWISADMNVVDLHTLQPCETKECPSVQPKEKAKYVLEVNADSFEGVVGDAVLFGKN